MAEWSASIGAIVEGTTTTFRVWAPDRESVDLVVEGDADLPRRRSPDIRRLTRDGRGYWVGRFADLGPGVLYRYRLDGRDDAVFPDPASRRQPTGVHGPSEVVDPNRFEWTDRAWSPPPLRDLILYELHVGAFTTAGTFRAVIERLPYLSDLGVTAIELMPVADFPGSRNWGYDGVALFAPARCYGPPDDLRALVDAAHRHGLAVHLDVVYNHLGPDGAYASAFSPYYFTDAHHTAWGAGVNLDGPRSPDVRRFFIENALHWVREYHMDGLRFDATHALQDRSSPHFLAEISTVIRAHASRPVVLAAEDHRNLAHIVRPGLEGGFGLDAVWADDFHHQVRAHTAGDREGYYADFSGSTPDLATTLRQGWFFTGQDSAHLGAPRGTSAAGIPPKQFVICIQNHDQVGNRADGARLHHQIDAASYRAATTLLLMAPQTPLLFMGQEWSSTSPFLFFTDHHEALGRLVTEGRRREFSSFAAFSDPHARAEIPDPQRADTFERSRLDWDEMRREPHGGTLRLYQRLLTLRRGSPAMRNATCASYDVRALDAHTLGIQLASVPDFSDGASGPPSPADTLHLVVRLSGAGTVGLSLPPGTADTLLTTEDAAFVERPAPIRMMRDASGAPVAHATAHSVGPWRIEFARPGAIIMGSRPAAREAS